MKVTSSKHIFFFLQKGTITFPTAYFNRKARERPVRIKHGHTYLEAICHKNIINEK